MVEGSILAKMLLLLVGAFIGAAATGGVELFIQNNNRNQEAKSLKAAFAGEVAALVEIAKGLEINEDLDGVIESVRRNEKPQRIYLSVKQDYFKVYKGNIDKLGLLDEALAKDICTFYTYCFSAIEYMNELSTKEWAEDISTELALKQMERLRTIVNVAIKRGASLQVKLNASPGTI